MKKELKYLKTLTNGMREKEEIYDNSNGIILDRNSTKRTDMVLRTGRGWIIFQDKFRWFRLHIRKERG